VKKRRENSGEFLRIFSVRQYSTSGLSQCARAGRRLKINNEYQQQRGRCVALHYSKLKIVVRIANKNCGGRFGSVITNIHMAPGGKIGKQTRDRWLLLPSPFVLPYVPLSSACATLFSTEPRPLLPTGRGSFLPRCRELPLQTSGACESGTYGVSIWFPKKRKSHRKTEKEGER